MAPMFLVTLIGCFLFAVYGALIDYYRRAWKAIPTFIPAPAGGASPGASPGSSRTKISVLVPARNEEANIVACIDSLSRQSYPKDLYQVIVINDHSTDRTWEILKGLHYTDLYLMCLDLADTPPGQPTVAHKKRAIEAGI